MLAILFAAGAIYSDSDVLMGVAFVTGLLIDPLIFGIILGRGLR